MPSATWSSALLGALLLACANPEPPPSLLVVTLDTLRKDHTGVYGGPADLTPHLDALAREALVHDAAYTTMPTTTPAHVSLFTGLHPSEHGSTRNGVAMRPDLAPRDASAILREHGYVTAAFVTTLLLGQRDTGLRGFETYDVPAGLLRPGADAVAAALAWLRVEPRRPVLLWVHLYDPHAPYGEAHEKRLELPLEQGSHGWVEAGRYADPEARREVAERYARGVRDADAALGRLLEGVGAQLERPPLVIVAADHGESLDEHLEERGYAYDHGEFLDAEDVEIPLLVAGPGVTPGRSAGAVSIRDVYTTLLEAAGVGDAAAAREGRRDLRVPSPERRVVRMERRSFETPPPEPVHAHAAAAADGSRQVIVGEDGSAAGDAAAADLLAAARQGLVEPGQVAGPEAIDPDTRRALRSLGYAE